MLFLSGSGKVYAWAEDAKPDILHNENSSFSKIRIVSTLSVRGKIYRMFYERNSAQVILEVARHKVILQRVPKGYNPALVGAEGLIGFLPGSIQPYIQRNILVSVSAVRSSGGGGGGQCGAGAEVYLNFIDISERVPKLKSKVLVDSCKESIELSDKEVASRVLGAISVVQDNIYLHFMNYKDFDDSPTAAVAPDFTGLIFK